MAKHNEIGEIGETMAASFLLRNGYKVLCRNYRKKWGELDIVAEKNTIVHFVEVKTVSRQSFGDHFAEQINNYRPEDNMHPWKLQRLRRAMQTYILEKYKTSDPRWQFDLICVFLNQEKRIARVRLMENIII